MKNNKKQERKKKKLRTLILLLFLTIIMFGTSTYAWFTANRTVTIQEISVNVQTSDGLQISTDGKTWKSTITTTDILQGYDGSNNFIPSSLDAVSTVGATRAATNNATRLFDMYSSTIGTNATTGNYTITTALVDETASPKKFVAFDVFLRVSSDKDVYLKSYKKNKCEIGGDNKFGIYANGNGKCEKDHVATTGYYKFDLINDYALLVVYANL